MSHYIKYKRSLFAFYICVIAILGLLQYLTHNTINALGYAIFLISVALVVILCVGFLLYSRKVIYLRRLIKTLSPSKGDFPGATNRIEQLYCELIDNLYDMLQSTNADLTEVYEENAEYYTLWIHQIKTPIAASGLILRGMQRDEQTQLLEQEIFKIERYAELALQYTKLAHIADDLIIERVSLEDTVRKAIRKYSVLFIYNHISVTIEGQDACVTTDAKWLGFVVEQLMSNALKYTAKGVITIHMGEGTLSIRDTGIGIRCEDIPRIFERGYTGFNGRQDTRASGLGLYMCKKVCGALAVKVAVSSEINVGSVFTLRFPKDMRDEYDKNVSVERANVRGIND